jgi:hypothetical protein
VHSIRKSGPSNASRINQKRIALCKISVVKRVQHHTRALDQILSMSKNEGYASGTRQRFIIGRATDNDIVIDDPSLSRRHCFLHVSSHKTFTLVDMGSPSGVSLYRNGEWVRVDKAILSLEDRIKIGDHETNLSALLIQLQNPSKLDGRRREKIFISYRRSDTEHIAGRMFDTLNNLYGPDNIFFDTATIPSAVEFYTKIQAAISESAVVLAVIGNDWVRYPPRFLGLFRSKKEDYVLRELQIAIGLMVPIIPILVGNTEMPKESSLPTAIRPIAKLNAIKVRAARDFHSDMQTVINTINQFRAGQNRAAK